MIDTPFKVIISKSTAFNTFEINGSLVISHIESIYKELKEKVDFSKKHIIEVDKVDVIDLTFVQLLLALKKEFIEYGTDFEIKLSLNDEQQQLLKNSGFETQFHN
jgi:anti-anti-sigma regulatory factor